MRCEHALFLHECFFDFVFRFVRDGWQNRATYLHQVLHEAGNSATKTPEMLCEAFGEHSFSWTAVFEWHSRFKSGRVSAEMTNTQSSQAPAKRQKMLKKFQNSSTKTVAEQSMSSQTLLGSVMEFAKRSQQKI
jgi:hypothetical protein